LFLLLMLALPLEAGSGTAAVGVVTINGPINPVTADYLGSNLAAAPGRGEQLVIIEMDTPGGLDDAMRSIVKNILSSPVPVAVHVTPSGARAASAGAVIALAADICAMTPGTNIGAAHPVMVGEQPDKVMQEKMVNDAEAYVQGLARKRGHNPDVAGAMVRQSMSLTAEKALADSIANLLATGRADLLRQLDGYRVPREGGDITLKLAGATVTEHPMGARQQFLNTISNPNVAYVLLMLGMLGLFFELSTPGAILPGVIGGISLILSFFAFRTLPVNYAGVLLILFALVLFIAEIKIVSNGMLTIGGISAMIFGSLLLFESPEPYLRVSWSVIFVTVLATVAFFVLIVAKAISAHKQRPVSGMEGLMGERGEAKSDISARGTVIIHGERWDAWSDEPIAAGACVRVIAMDNLRLKVEKVEIPL
jgi:membrane-bound serine protease (ClpP class)